MKLTKSKLRQAIREELTHVLCEAIEYHPQDPQRYGLPPREIPKSGYAARQIQAFKSNLPDFMTDKHAVVRINELFKHIKERIAQKILNELGIDPTAFLNAQKKNPKLNPIDYVKTLQDVDYKQLLKSINDKYNWLGREFKHYLTNPTYRANANFAKEKGHLG
jgi:hypothetical protein